MSETFGGVYRGGESQGNEKLLENMGKETPKSSGKVEPPVYERMILGIFTARGLVTFPHYLLGCFFCEKESCLHHNHVNES